MADGKLITIDEWRERFSKPPALATIYRWIKRGQMIPEPVKYGRQYYLTPEAKYEKTRHHRPD